MRLFPGPTSSIRQEPPVYLNRKIVSNIIQKLMKSRGYTLLLLISTYMVYIPFQFLPNQVQSFRAFYIVWYQTLFRTYWSAKVHFYLMQTTFVITVHYHKHDFKVTKNIKIHTITFLNGIPKVVSYCETWNFLLQYVGIKTNWIRYSCC